MKNRGKFLLFAFSLILFSNFCLAGELKVTQEHPFLINGEWISAYQLKAGDNLTTLEGKNITIKSIKDFQTSVPFSVYNLEDDFGINNFVVGNNIVVHNSEISPKLPFDQLPKFPKELFGIRPQLILNPIKEGYLAVVNDQTLLFRGMSYNQINPDGSLNVAPIGPYDHPDYIKSTYWTPYSEDALRLGSSLLPKGEKEVIAVSRLRDIKKAARPFGLFRKAEVIKDVGTGNWQIIIRTPPSLKSLNIPGIKYYGVDPSDFPN